MYYSSVQFFWNFTFVFLVSEKRINHFISYGVSKLKTPALILLYLITRRVTRDCKKKKKKRNTAHLNTMIVLVDDDEATPSVDGDSGRTIELARAVAVSAESSDERAVVPVDLYAIVGSIADYNVALLVAGDAPRSAEIVRAFVAEVADDLNAGALDV